MKAGFPVLPILPIGRDALGHQIQAELLREAVASQMPAIVTEWLESELFLLPHLKTQQSTILVQQGAQQGLRTIFTERPQGAQHFFEALKARVDQLPVEIKAIMIGDIQADSPVINPELAGACTQYLVNRFTHRAMVLANPGMSQIILGQPFWAQWLQPLNILQLNVAEMRTLLQPLISSPALADMIHWLNSKSITAVITLDQFGVVACYKEGQEGIILASAVDLKDLVDTTGAGDAFAAALTAQLDPEFSFADFKAAIAEARLWAAYACRYLGGSAHCPTQDQLSAFKQAIADQEKNSPTVKIVDIAEIPCL
ncbi:MAG: carbohydrate kinase family protein, partial [Microcoleaceae cyanobacterium]